MAADVALSVPAKPNFTYTAYLFFSLSTPALCKSIVDGVALHSFSPGRRKTPKPSISNPGSSNAVAMKCEPVL